MADLHSLLQPLLEHASVRAAMMALAQPGARPVALSGLTPAAKALVVAALAHQLQRPVVVLTRDNEAAQAYRQTTATFLEWLKPGAGSSVQILPAMDCTPYEGRSPHAEIQEQRAVALWNMARGGVRVIFAPVAAALGRFREGGFYASLALDLKVGDELNLEDLVEHLRSVGYEPGEPVAAVEKRSRRASRRPERLAGDWLARGHPTANSVPQSASSIPDTEWPSATISRNRFSPASRASARLRPSMSVSRTYQRARRPSLSRSGRPRTWNQSCLVPALQG